MRRFSSANSNIPAAAAVSDLNHPAGDGVRASFPSDNAVPLSSIAASAQDSAKRAVCAASAIPAAPTKSKTAAAAAAPIRTSTIPAGSTTPATSNAPAVLPSSAAAPARKRKHRRWLRWVSAACAAVVLITTVLLTPSVILPAIRYALAAHCYDTADYEQAVTRFEALGSYRDSAARMRESRYARASVLVNMGYFTEAEALYGALGDEKARQETVLLRRSTDVWDAVGLQEYTQALALARQMEADGITQECLEIRRTIASDLSRALSIGNGFVVGRKKDGTAIAAGFNEFHACDVGDWTDIAAVSAGTEHTVGLKSDGTLVAVGENTYHQCDTFQMTGVS